MGTRHALGSWRIFTTLGAERKKISTGVLATLRTWIVTGRRCGFLSVFERQHRHPRGHIRHTVGPRTSHDVPSPPPGVLKRYRSCQVGDNELRWLRTLIRSGDGGDTRSSDGRKTPPRNRLIGPCKVNV